ncbi:MAG: PAS domain S-box protein [Bacteroidetes bacterium]|nr:PAS domain S-box protein [Bacteroidota bacterium]
MKSIFNKIAKGILIDSIPAEDILTRQRYALFRIFSIIGALSLIIFAIEESSFTNLNDAKIFIFFAVAISLIINLIGVKFHGNLTVAFTISIITALGLIHCVTYYSGGIRNPDFFYMGSIILYSYIILENKGGILTLVLSLANIIYFYALSDFTDQGVYITYNLSERAIDTKHLYTVVSSMVLMTSLSSYLAYSKNAVISKIEESKGILIKKNEELQELSLVASETINSVIITDADGSIEWVNDGFTRLTGYTPVEVLGSKTINFLYGSKSNPETVEILEKRNFSSNNFSTEIIKYRKDGEMVWVQENVTRIVDDGENNTKYIFIESDISERKRSEEKMSEYLKNLEKTNKELDKFAYVVSHDLKAPLRAIGNLTGWIEEDAGHLLPNEVRKNFNLIKERVIRMESLINGILDYSKAAKKNNQLEIVDVNNLVKETIEFLGQPKNCSFIVKNELPELLCDKVKLQQVFMNLIGNAIKFNSQENKFVTISSQQTKDHYQFSIYDNGPGIDSRFHDKIFLIFQTISSRDDFESTGVGLAIVKKIIEEQNGKIWVESIPGNGATFHFSWPKCTIPKTSNTNILEEKAEI